MNRMYQRALETARQKINGGPKAPYFKKPYLDAAFNGNIFQWDTCFIAAWAKYHIKELPIEQALDNFYDLQEPDGFICREYTLRGEPLWDKDHPVSINPPLFPFAELELYSQSKNLSRLKKVYSAMKKYHEFLMKKYRMPDGLFYGDTLGSGMDNIPRWSNGWKNDGKGLKPKPLLKQYAQFYESDARRWNIQGRFIDLSAQMAFGALCLKQVAQLIGKPKDIPIYEKQHSSIKQAINDLCWDNKENFYFDLGFDKQIKRFHIGAYWTLIADVVPKNRLDKFIAHLKDTKKFNRPVPVPSLAHDEPEYKPWGDYWCGGVWAPTTYMVIRGLDKVGEKKMAQDIAFRFYAAVTHVFNHTNTFWENYSPEIFAYGRPAMYDFCGWTALAPIAIYREYIKSGNFQ